MVEGWSSVWASGKQVTVPGGWATYEVWLWQRGQPSGSEWRGSWVSPTGGQRARGLGRHRGSAGALLLGPRILGLSRNPKA